ncbi:MAG: 4Fe-4S binding protein [Candidatus Altiarchaeota archaeon]
MTKRRIVKIDLEKCNGCGLCIPNCPEGALQIIDGKARLVSDLFCDGLGACIGHCPRHAIKVVERKAESYDERKVMENIAKQGKNTIKAHLEHLKEHGEVEYLNQAVDFLKERRIEIPFEAKKSHQKDGYSGCPGAKMIELPQKEGKTLDGEVPSGLRQWPIQLHLISPLAPYYQEKDVVLAADCTAYSLGDFHRRYLKGKSLAIACPKLDSEQEVYVEKIAAMIDEAKINTLTVVIMQVPCCRGLLEIAKKAAKESKRKIPIKSVVVGIQGNILSEEWVRI